MIADSLVLAKAPSHGRQVTLADHTRDVLTAVSAMFGDLDHPTRLGSAWLEFFRLAGSDFRSFYVNLWLAAAFHDLGKANDGFQASVRRRGEQTLRHEHLSALLLRQQPLIDWLGGQSTAGADPDLIIGAVASHHLKVSDRNYADWLSDSDRAAVRVLHCAPDVSQIAALAVRKLGVSPPDLQGIPRGWDRESIEEPRDRFQRAMRRFKAELEANESRRRLLLAVKAALVAADSAGSAIVRVGGTLEDWLGEAFEQSPLSESDVEQAVIRPRVQELVRRGRWQGFKDFQLAAAELGTRALLLSGCGTGKTLAAWKWITAQLRRKPAARVIFLYPTRGTATEGFRDYVSWAGPDAALLHGTARYDLDGMFDNPEDPRQGRDYTTRERLFALGYWNRRIFSATVDSFLALMSNHYAALCMAPVLADSVVVIDEVHSFDSSMFRALERFLDFFDLPVLCMTASLPPEKLNVLQRSCQLEVFPRNPAQFADLSRQEQVPRYRVRMLTEDEALQVARDAFAARKKVLWVVNRVSRCQEVARRLAGDLGQQLGDAVRCYHSRYRLIDRKERHDAAIAGLGIGQSGPIILVSTQVCEMSLDLDADVLITEIASVPALIQRMGRCCREPIPADGRVGEVYFYLPATPRPYARNDIADGERFGQYLAEQDTLAHADLAAYLERTAPRHEFAVGGFTGFIDSGWYAMARDDSFREDDDYSCDAVLDCDVPAYLRERDHHSGRAAGYIVPVPRRLGSPDSRLGAFVRLASAAHYDPDLGFVEPEAERGG